MDKEKKSKKGIVWSFALLLLFIISIIILRSSGLIYMNPDLKSYGHGDISKSSGDSFLTSLGISRTPDYYDEGTGETYCFEPECWIYAEFEYEDCIDDLDFVEFSRPNEIYSYFEIIPAVSAIVPDDDGEEDLCDDIYWDTLTTECAIECNEETYTWDGSPITDVDAFFSTNYPNFYDKSRFTCGSFIYDGDWVSEPGRVGCENGRFMGFICDGSSPTYNSARTVCETIGKTWVCDDTQVLCVN